MQYEKTKCWNEGRIETIQELFPLMVERKIQIPNNGKAWTKIAIDWIFLEPVWYNGWDWTNYWKLWIKELFPYFCPKVIWHPQSIPAVGASEFRNYNWRRIHSLWFIIYTLWNSYWRPIRSSSRKLLRRHWNEQLVELALG